MFLLVLLFPAALSAQEVGKPQTLSPGVSETVTQIMARAILDPTDLSCRQTEPELEEPDRSHLPQNPLSKPDASYPPAPANNNGRTYSPNSVLSPQTLGTSFTGATLSGTNPTLAFPPDNMGAVGPTQYIIAVNGRIVTYNKSTGVADGVMNTSTDNFFSSVRNASGTSDPRIRYDRITARWFIVIINVSTPNRILIAVSDAASAGVITASTVWTYFFIPIDSTVPTISNTCLADYPTLGVDVNALYIGTNNFCGSPSQTFNSTDGYVIRKSSILGAGPAVVTVFRGLVPTSASDGPYTPQGVDNYSTTATEGYFIGVSNAVFGKLMIRRVSTPGGTPTISADIPLTVSSTSSPITVPHLGNTGGTNGNLDGLDDRLFAAHIRNGRLWTAHNIQVNTTGASSGTGGRNGSRWYEIQNLTGTPSVVQSGTIFDNAATNPQNYSIPSVMVSGQGHAAFSLTTAGTNNRANAATVGRLATDATGTTGTVALTTASSTAYNPPSDNGAANGSRRWGDYSYVSLDPKDDMTMWMINEFCNATNSYGCNITKLIAPPPATPASCSPSAVAGNQTSVNVVVTGTAVSGSGFYDPGANMAAPALAFNHISATATGGIVVNSVTYTDPTHITLNINTTSVPVGNYSITVTNPDGQSTPSASAILSVTAPLPVTSLGLSARLNSNLTVLLNWATETEFHNRGFYIERNETNDINNWQTLGFVSGAGNNSLRKNYSYVDNNISLGHNYKYRLRQVDIDNQFSFSNEVLVRVKDMQKDMLLLNSFPNPFRNTSSINYNLPSSGNVSIKLFNAVGAEIALLANQYQQQGTYSIAFDADKYKLSRGVYYCTLVFNGEKLITKMVVTE